MPRGGGRSSSGNRSSSSGGGGGFFNRGPARSTAAPPRPAPVRQAPTPAPVQQAPAAGGGMMSGIGGTIVQGMAFGAGSEVAHQAVRSMMGGGGGHGNAPQQQQQVEQQPMQQQYAPVDQQQQVQQDPCAGFNMNLVNCLKNNTEGIGMCQDYMNMLQQCQKDQSMRF